MSSFPLSNVHQTQTESVVCADDQIVNRKDTPVALFIMSHPGHKSKKKRQDHGQGNQQQPATMGPPASKARKPGSNAAASTQAAAAAPPAEADDQPEFEDAFELELEDEVIVNPQDGIDVPVSGDYGDMMMEEEEEDGKEQTQVWLPGMTKEEVDPEDLDYDSSAYNAFHRLRVEWPCLSFDIVRDSLGAMRTKFPHTMYVAAGTQAAKADQNKLMLIKVSDLHKTQHDDRDVDDIDGSDSDPDDLDNDPIVEEKSVAHPGGVNRLRAMPQRAGVVATWADTGSVHIWDLRAMLQSMDVPPGMMLPTPKPVLSFSGHPSEGFAMAWSPTVPGRLMTGDCTKHIYMWNPVAGGWAVDKAPYAGHTASVEDVQWSPVEKDVFASCSVDKTVRIWDARVKQRSMLFVAAHKEDVNVISWNAKAAHLLVSGSDDGTFKIWDLRKFKSNTPAAHFKWHKGAITSVAWHTHEESMLAVGSADNSISIWDLALEEETEADVVGSGAALPMAIPPQLVFLHQGQKDIKELHFHPQIPSMIVSTALSGFNFFRPANMESSPGSAAAAAAAATPTPGGSAPMK